MKMVSLEAAMEMSGHTDKRALWRWIGLHNNRHPSKPIFRRHGKVDAHTLEEALQMESYDKQKEAAQ